MKANGQYQWIRCPAEGCNAAFPVPEYTSFPLLDPSEHEDLIHIFLHEHGDDGASEPAKCDAPGCDPTGATCNLEDYLMCLDFLDYRAFLMNNRWQAILTALKFLYWQRNVRNAGAFLRFLVEGGSFLRLPPKTRKQIARFLPRFRRHLLNADYGTLQGWLNTERRERTRAHKWLSKWHEDSAPTERAPS